MQQTDQMQSYIHNVIDNLPKGWLSTTTHRLDIYNEEKAKSEFLSEFEKLYKLNKAETSALEKLPTAYDYIRLGHPLSCVLEWAVAHQYQLNPQNVISFSSKTMPILAVLRKNLFDKKNTLIAYADQLPPNFDAEIISKVYGYSFEIQQVDDENSIPEFDGSVVFISNKKDINALNFNSSIDFLINLQDNYGSILMINNHVSADYVKEVQHVRRRESIAMTPADCLTVLKKIVIHNESGKENLSRNDFRESVYSSINEVTGTTQKPLVASSGLSIQYAILMGFIEEALEKYPGKDIKILVPPNCYGGTNDQSRRVAACVKNAEIVDLLVDDGNDMVSSLDSILTEIAKEDAIPYIIAEIPTNPRVEVPNLEELRDVLRKNRLTSDGHPAIAPVFVLDQTFCPDVRYVGEGDILSDVQTIVFSSGSKFPSGGKCTSGYCVGNDKTHSLMAKVEKHLEICDNEATALQYKILASQMPSMKQRVEDAYKNTREFVDFVKETIPEAKINFVSEELAEQGFTPSVFSLDLPSSGDTHEERETNKRELHNELIKMMISEIPNEAKHCVSYGQLKGSYWTVPATSTQGTTKEGDKDYVARISISPLLSMERHKQVFLDFVRKHMM